MKWLCEQYTHTHTQCGGRAITKNTQPIFCVLLTTNIGRMADPYIIYRQPDFVSHADWIISLRLQLWKGQIPLEHVQLVQELITEHHEMRQVGIS